MAVIYPDVSGICSMKLNHDIYKSQDAVKWAMNHGLLANHRVCHCQSPMSLSTRNSTNDGCVWRCSNQTCRSTKSVRHGSFYEKCHIPLNKCIMMTYYWSFNDIGLASVGELLHLSTFHTLPDWFNMHRDLCTFWMRDHPTQIGGPEHVVVIDETVVSAPKRVRNQIARPSRQRWIFGGIDQQTKEAFLVEVAQRDAATLLPIIQRYVLPGTTIWSDQWAEYRDLTAHTTDNHPVTFVAPNGVHTNDIEKLWRCAKDKLKKMRGISDAHISSYLDEFLWRKLHGNRSSCFQHALELIRRYYPV